MSGKKYIVKESVLHEIIKNIVSEELSEGFFGNVGRGAFNAVKNTAGMAAKSIISPFSAVGDLMTKANGLLNGNETITGSVNKFFGGGNSGGQSVSRGGRKAQRQQSKVSAGKNISYEYGKPETVPSWGNRIKLDDKSEIVAPPYDSNKRTGCTLPWGSFGVHYHDEGDRMWNRIVTDKERTILRLSANNDNKRARLLRKYKKILVDWLKERDRAYKDYIKQNNRL